MAGSLSIETTNGFSQRVIEPTSVEIPLGHKKPDGPPQNAEVGTMEIHQVEGSNGTAFQVIYPPFSLLLEEGSAYSIPLGNNTQATIRFSKKG